MNDGPPAPDGAPWHRLSEHALDVGVGLVCLLGIFLFLLGSSYLFRWGRFSTSQKSDYSIPYAIADFFVKLINDFRHLLALLVFGLFAVTLWRAMTPGLQLGNFAMMEDGLKSVAAVLGPTVGLIIGYYFGESAVRRTTTHPEHKAPQEAQPKVEQGTCNAEGIPAIGAPPVASANGGGQPLADARQNDKGGA